MKTFSYELAEVSLICKAKLTELSCYQSISLTAQPNRWCIQADVNCFQIQTLQVKVRAMSLVLATAVLDMSRLRCTFAEDRLRDFFYWLFLLLPMSGLFFVLQVKFGFPPAVFQINYPLKAQSSYGMKSNIITTSFICFAWLKNRQR